MSAKVSATRSDLQDEEGLVPGLCATCVNVNVVRSPRGSVFYRCLLSKNNPEFPKYPRLPVLICDGWAAADPR
jgi:hypothetical protein